MLALCQYPDLLDQAPQEFPEDVLATAADEILPLKDARVPIIGSTGAIAARLPLAR